MKRFRFHWLDGKSTRTSVAQILKQKYQCLLRILQCHRKWGHLTKVVLYPCHCGRLTIDEWYEDEFVNDHFHKETSVVEVANVDEARDIYRNVFGELHESHYIPEKDSYTSKDERDNFIVTGSHCTCSKHRSPSKSV